LHGGFWRKNEASLPISNKALLREREKKKKKKTEKPLSPGTIFPLDSISSYKFLSLDEQIFNIKITNPFHNQ
jgi:hypothetical protein